MKEISKNIDEKFMDSFGEEDFEEAYEDIIAEISERCCRQSQHSEFFAGLSAKVGTHDFTDLPKPVQQQIESYKECLELKIYRRSILLYDIAHFHCWRAITSGMETKDILSMAKRTAPSLLDNEDPFGNVEPSHQYKQSQHELDSLDFSDLQSDVIMRILHLTADVIEEQTYLSAMLYYMGTKNCLRLLEKWGIIQPTAV